VDWHGGKTFAHKEVPIGTKVEDGEPGEESAHRGLRFHVRRRSDELLLPTFSLSWRRYRVSATLHFMSLTD
jgi:hypothetical protein